VVGMQPVPEFAAGGWAQGRVHGRGGRCSHEIAIRKDWVVWRPEPFLLGPWGLVASFPDPVRHRVSA
jgi:hypothetical protein